MNIYNETKFIMQKYDVHPNKNLGQNFLFDEVALQTIIQDLTSDGRESKESYCSRS